MLASHLLLELARAHPLFFPPIGRELVKRTLEKRVQGASEIAKLRAITMASSIHSSSPYYHIAITLTALCSTSSNVHLLTLAANLGNLIAQFHLGERYVYGRGVDKIPNEAIKFFTPFFTARARRSTVFACRILRAWKRCYKR